MASCHRHPCLAMPRSHVSKSALSTPNRGFLPTRPWLSPQRGVYRLRQKFGQRTPLFRKSRLSTRRYALFRESPSTSPNVTVSNFGYVPLTAPGRAEMLTARARAITRRRWRASLSPAKSAPFVHQPPGRPAKTKTKDRMSGVTIVALVGGLTTLQGR